MQAWTDYLYLFWTSLVNINVRSKVNIVILIVSSQKYRDTYRYDKKRIVPALQVKDVILKTTVWLFVKLLGIRQIVRSKDSVIVWPTLVQKCSYVSVKQHVECIFTCLAIFWERINLTLNNYGVHFDVQSALRGQSFGVLLVLVW